MLGRGGLTLAVLSFVAGVCIPAEMPPTLEERTIAVQNFSTEKLAIWQKRLNLESWKITVKLVRASELKPKTLGNIHWDTPVKAANIRVLTVSDYRLPYDKMLDDIEFTIVHELVHLQLSSLPRSEASRGAEERAVNQITQALLNLDRRN